MPNGPDHIVVTGDLVNISLPREFLRAAAWLTKLGPPRDVSVIPGQSRRLCAHRLGALAGALGRLHGGRRRAMAASTRPRAPTIFPICAGADRWPSSAFPPPRPCRPTVLPAASVPSRWSAWRRLLARTRQDGCCRVVLIHHPPLPGSGFRPQAASRQRRVSRRHRQPGRRADPAWAYPCLRPCPASLARRQRARGGRAFRLRARMTGHKDHARYHLYRIDKEIAGWRILVDVRGVGRGCESLRQGARLHPACRRLKAGHISG